MSCIRVGVVVLVSVVAIAPFCSGQGRITRALEQGPKAAAAAKPTVLTPIPGLRAGLGGPHSVSALNAKTPSGLAAGLTGHTGIAAAFQADKTALSQARAQRLQMIPGLDASVARLKAPRPKALKSPAPPIDPAKVIKK